ncbi:helix-turn-helix domain-containing protein [Actinoplanes missouriensis]|uniref:helix-turn-helix domain-containing protein n=1 Tax=Actinoplanes missouriensis TaxID=1866 RepID=UPI00340EEB99
MANDLSFGALLRRLRLAADLTVKQLAEASGVSVRAIGDIERGARRPRAGSVAAIADGLRLDAGARADLLAAVGAGRPTMITGLPLPRRVHDFTGRDSELSRIARWCAGGDTPFVLIHGAPGVGKTTLALHAAQAWPLDAQLFVDLRGLDAEPLTAAAVLGQLIRAVDPDLPAVPGGVEEAAKLWHDVIRDRPIVVVLDNAISEDQVRAVRPPHGPAVVLVTSRRVMSNLPDVRRLPLGVLPDADAVRLLEAILGDAQATTAELHRISELCANVPLALRIAGNRLLSRPGWTAAVLINRLAAQERRLTFLTAGDLEVRAAFTLSYQQLSEPAQRLLRRLSLVPGPSAGVELAAVLAEQPLPVTESLLDELVELSLLQQRSDGCLEFHDLLRLYAVAQLRQNEDQATIDALTTRRDTWLLDTAIRAGQLFEPASGSTPTYADDVVTFTTEAQAGAWLRQEAANWLSALRSAAAAGDDRRVVEVATSLNWFSDGWELWPHWVDVYTLSSRAAQRLGDDGQQSIQLRKLAKATTGYGEALDRAHEARAAAERSGDPRLVAWAEYYIARALIGLGRPLEAIKYAQTAVLSFRVTSDDFARPYGLMVWARALQAIGPADDAIPMLERAIMAASALSTGSPPRGVTLFVEAVARISLTAIEIDAQRWRPALRRVNELIRVAGKLEHWVYPMLSGLSQRAQILAGLGDLHGARADLVQLRDLLRRTGTPAPRQGVMHERIVAVERLLGGHGMAVTEQ